ncbi:MAG: hypothetical protein HPY55_07110 [Firmicutes bacterium]|nr:hypothetical protein [Bacillota bacterium]
MQTRFRWNELLAVSFTASMSILTKPYVRAPFAFVQNALGMPVGVFIGGIYMFWPLLAGVAIRRPGAVMLTCLMQGLVALVTGFTGLLGPAAFFSYLSSGIVIEGLFFAARRVRPDGADRILALVLAGALGNVAGAVTNACLFFALRGAVFTVAVASSLISGAGGGWLAYVVGQRVAGLLRPTARSATEEAVN